MATGGRSSSQVALVAHSRALVVVAGTPLQPLQYRALGANSGGDFVEAAVELVGLAHPAVEVAKELGIDFVDFAEEVGEAALVGELWHVVDGLPHDLYRGVVVERRCADGAVHGDHAACVLKQGR